MDSFYEIIRKIEAAYAIAVAGVMLPLVIYPITILPSTFVLRQLAFAKSGVFYEPGVTDYVLNVFGLIRISFGIILAVCICFIVVGVARILYLKKNT